MDSRERALVALKAAVKPLYADMFTRAHAITCDDREAELALERAIIACALDDTEEGFAAYLKQKVTEFAIARAAGARADANGNSFECFVSGGEGALAGALARQSEDVKRMALLRYGLMLTSRQIALVTHTEPRQIKRALDALEERLCAGGSKRERVRVKLREACAKELERESYAPDFNTMMRAVELELNRPLPKRTGALWKRAVSWLMALLSLLLLAAMLWVGVLLLDYFREARARERTAPVQISYRAEEYDARA